MSSVYFTNKNNIIYPVVFSVPEKKRKLKGKEKVLYLSQYARDALALSAEKKQIKIKSDNLLKNENGAPVPFHGTYWSVTHKSEYVGGVIASEKIGIDIEKIRPFSKGLFEKITNENERNLITNTEPLKLFFRYWTSKEAVLKAVGTGIKDLLKCRITEITDAHHLIIKYQEKEWFVEHFYFDSHIASVVKNGFHTEWSLFSE